MHSPARSHARTSQLLLLSLAVHAGVIGALWVIIHTHPAILSELNPSRWSALPVEIEGSQRGNLPTARKNNSPSEKLSAPKASTSSSESATNTASNSQGMDHSDPVANTLSSSAEPQNGGTTKTDGGAVAIAQGDPYFSQVRSKIQSQIHYTPVMARWRLQGQVQIALTLLSDGSIASLNIQKSSGSAELDQQALNSVRAAIPFPSFSSTAPARKLELPIDFRLN